MTDTNSLAWFPALSTDASWQCLPPRLAGEAGQLPVWARVLAQTLPRTTAAMLEMDHLQRGANFWSATFRARVRVQVARLHHCRYSEETALADAQRTAAATDDQPDAETQQFIAQLTTQASQLTDRQVESLAQRLGVAPLVELVLLVAYANFQDRLLHLLGLGTAPGSAGPPPEVRFDWSAAPPAAPAPRTAPAAAPEVIPLRLDDPDWQALPWDELRQKLAEQQYRAPRIPLPEPEVVAARLPPGLYPPGQSTAILWNAATFGYEPRLPTAWLFTLRRFAEDSQFFGELRQTLFWVITRSLQCFY